MAVLPDLYLSLEQDNHKKLHKLLVGGADVDYLFEDDGRLSGKSLLHLCCEKGRVECAKLLIRNGADINIRDRWGQTPLMHCVIARNLNLAKFLLSWKKSSVRCQDKFGKTALHFGVEEGCEEAVKLLLWYGSDVNASTMCGLTPLINLCSQPPYPNQITLLDVLLTSGAVVNMRDFRCKRSALQAAALQKNIKVVEKLLSWGADPNSLDRAGRSALTNVISECLSAYEINREIDPDVMTVIVQLTQAGSDLNITKCKCSNPLIVSTFLKVEPLVRFFLDNGACPDVTLLLRNFQSGMTPLLVAVNKGDAAVTRALISHGCRMDVRGRITRRPDEEVYMDPFELAIENASWDLVKYMVSAGYHPSNLAYLRSGSSSVALPTSLRINKDMLDFLRTAASQPTSLFQSTALMIWRTLGSDLPNKVRLLSLPSSLKCLIMSEAFLSKY
ncbi:uncharacterized protein LOC110464598 [Mizuhopecten yessoensis]|uniref:uncharacterized protein LOC110464598 n=1 Tax=Mizuhopecten yessoensis TaxID=6573 RepID=UPI000B458575|nr:uncharacterized protein LOC110464598 [Mizuhopecten yessoensis]